MNMYPHGIVWVGAPNRPFAICDNCSKVTLSALPENWEFSTVTVKGYECRVCGWAIKPMEVSDVLD